MHSELRDLPQGTDVSVQVLVRLADFARTLRANGFAVGLKESEDAARVIGSDMAVRPAALRSALKSLFCARRSDWLKFDDIFDAFWLGRGIRTVVRMSAQAKAATPAELRQLAGPDAQHATGPGPRRAGVARGRRCGAGFRQSGPHGRRLARRASRRDGFPQDRRPARDRRGARAGRAPCQEDAHTAFAAASARATRAGEFDLRRTIRRNISHGGVPIELVWRKRKRRPLRLVVLLDASGSMSLYTSVFVRFIHGVLDHFREAEAFLFHTRLVHVSAAMREKDVGRALERLSLLAQGVGGGTRIGESLAAFNRWHAPSVIHSRTCVMIISDGYDTGGPAALGAQMQQLARRCRRIVWLNPMLGWEGYEPSARGMQAALPHVDLFAPAHSLQSLAALEPYLARL